MESRPIWRRACVRPYLDRMSREWGDIVALHDRATADFAAAARRAGADPEIWSAPASPGKWSPAQIVQHVVLALEAARRELREGVPMQLRTRAWQRLVLRFTLQRRLMRGGAFPRGARAPREARPHGDTGPADSLIARLELLNRELISELGAALTSRPRLRLLHPYFGRLSVADMVYVSARHIQHHEAQLNEILQRSS
jgi:hypothetical protein